MVEIKREFINLTGNTVRIYRRLGIYDNPDPSNLIMEIPPGNQRVRIADRAVEFEIGGSTIRVSEKWVVGLPPHEPDKDHYRVFLVPTEIGPHTSTERTDIYWPHPDPLHELMGEHLEGGVILTTFLCRHGKNA